jgi:hypothetical protein
MNLSRRTILRGAGVSLGLPWLEAMAATGDTAGKPPIRMAALYMPNGVNPWHWKPEGTGRDFQLSTTLKPLEDLKSQITVMTNLWNENSKGGDGHYVKEAAWLTCRRSRRLRAPTSPTAFPWTSWRRNELPGRRRCHRSNWRNAGGGGC